MKLNQYEVLVDSKYGPGDGTVNLRSLEGCTHWENKLKQKVFAKNFAKIKHMDMVKSNKVFEYMKDIL